MSVKKMEMKATRDAYGEVLAELGAENKDIVVLDADLAKSTKTVDFAKKFPDRFFDVGIAEANMIGMAAGLATAGKIPFASTFALFGTLRVGDQIRNSICYPNLNVKIAVTHSGLTLGEDGASHQAVEDVALMRAIPNMTVIVPADAVETKKVIRTAAETYGPMYIRMGRPKVPVLFDDSYQFQIGKGVQIKDGSDVTIIAMGVMAHIALEAAEDLAKEGISARVINMSTIKPIDQEIIIRAAQETRGIVTAEEANIYGGLGGAVAEVLAENYPAPLRRVGVMDTFGESGTPDALLQKYGLTKENIMEKAKTLL
ncbi:transketolase family protein [Microaerobacter geothermalis]|uniref:transketolase family protein n=1 Tax=Microaerobacter geothermalis TaxID=674972 RepID=UPI001F1EADAA|nr:transketolase family protein [Microaerobacter geothermalis]MCF6093437.1 transketolase family protein [Microaerobacter geothermalis]